MNKQEKENQAIIEDLPVDEARQDEVKGGNPATHNIGALRNVASFNI